jgi:Cu(I)/Ag(I) efflux system membrane fusion protein/cobalt-zinc-cadmium efflux system membrane fusion protein
LTLGDSVVLNGNFLIDSQAHLGSGMSGLYGGSREFAAAQKNESSATSSTSNNSETSAVKIDFHSDPNPMKAGEDNQFRVTLTDADGKPINDARVTVTLIMPAMPSMGMPEMKSSSELEWKAGSKTYEGKGQAPMAGTWTVLVEARKNSNVIASMRTHLSAR